MPEKDDAELTTELEVTVVKQDTETEVTAEAATAKIDDSYVDTSNERVTARIGKITGKMYAEKQRADSLQIKLDAINSDKPAEIEPILEDFEFDEDAHKTALIQYHVKNQLAAERIESTAKKDESLQKQAAQDEFDAYEVAALEFIKTKPDYKEGLARLPEFNANTYQLLLKSKNPSLVYKLSNDPETAYALAAMNQIDAALEIGRLSASTLPNVKISAAPEPFDPIGTGGETLPDDWDTIAKGCTFE